MKLKPVLAIILVDIALIAFIAYKLVEYGKTDGGVQPPVEDLPPHQNISLYGVLLGDGGVNGEVFGCGDSLVIMRSYQSEQYRKVEEGLIVEALRELVSIPNADLGQGIPDGSIYTGAYQPGLTIEGIEKNGNVANVFMSGNPVFGGVCDTPRFEKQLSATVTQFEGVDYARFYLNGSEENFRKALSGR